MGNGTQGRGGGRRAESLEKGQQPRNSEPQSLPCKLGVIVSPASCTVQRPEESVHLNSQNSARQGAGAAMLAVG